MHATRIREILGRPGAVYWRKNRRGGKRYAIRPGSSLAIGAGGTAGDWSYGERGALSFLVELRPQSSDDGGFVVPPERIAPACDESLAGVLALAEWLIAHPRGQVPSALNASR